VAACNQDSLVVQQVLTYRGRILLAAVCDGIGGLPQGEAASGYMTERLQEWFYGDFMRAVRDKKPYWVIRRSLERLVFHAQEELRQYGKREQIELGTTMSVLVLWENTYMIWHLGDSRIYRLQGGGRHRMAVRQLTRDHTAGQHRLTKCVGSFGYFRPDGQLGTLREQDVFLLCSDGFYSHIKEQELEEALCHGHLREEEQIERRLKEIGDACMKRGEKDNLSAVCVKVER
jgi:serine/threonine protein phosphatase PrpC